MSDFKIFPWGEFFQVVKPIFESPASALFEIISAAVCPVIAQ